MTVTLTKNHLIATVLGALFTAFSLAFWFVTEYSWVFAIAALLVLVVALVWWLRNRDDDETRKQKQAEKLDSQQVKKLFRRFMQELKSRGQTKRKYRLPWYLYLTQDLQNDSNILTQMGFRNSDSVNLDNQLPVQIWLKSDAVLLAANINSQDLRSLTCLKLLLKKVRGYRSRQPLNGILLSQSIKALLTANKPRSQQLANDFSLSISESQSVCGQKLPVYCLFNQMAGLADFCQYFASLDESELDGAFGVMNHEHKGQFDSQWFHSNFDQLTQRLSRGVLSAIDSQLSESFRQSVVAAPMQFNQMKQGMAYFLEQIFAGRNDEQFQFRGFFFTNTEQQSQTADPMTQHLAYQLGYNEMLVPEQVKLPHSIFISRLFNKFIRPEAGLAGINQQRRRLFWFIQGSYASLMLVLTFVVVALLKINFDYKTELNDRAFKQLEVYKQAIRHRPYDIEELALNVANLKVLRDIYQDYHQPRPAYILDMVPNPGIGKSIEQAYHQQLSDILLPSLVRYLEEELFVYETLGNSLETAKLLNLNEELQQHSRGDWQHLEQYYRQSLINEGHDEQVLLDDLSLLMTDLYQFGVPEVKIDQELLAQARKSIDTINTTEVIFDYIRNLPEFSGFVDIDNELGNNFQQVYQFSADPTNKLLPLIFTPQGFAAMDLTPDSELMQSIINNNKALLGQQLNQYEAINLSKSLWRYYQRQYVNYWLKFIASISLRPLTEDNFRHNLSLLASRADSPPNRLYNLIGHYTQLQHALPAPQAKQEAQEAEKLDQQKATIARQIQAEFSVYHQFIQQDDKGVSELSNLHTVLGEVKKWLDEASQNEDAGAYYFKQLTSNKNSSLLHLQQADVSLTQVKQQLQTLVSMLNAMVQRQVAQYLNQRWQQQIYTGFEGQLANKFPFKLDAQQDVSFEVLNSFFKPGGNFEQFQQQYLQSFQIDDDRMLLAGYTPDAPMVIPASTAQQFQKISAIQKALFQQSDKQFSISFKLKTQSMSSGATSFELFSGRKLFVYQHGPKLWHNFQWPDPNLQSELLTRFDTAAGKRLVQSYQGKWNWLRLIYPTYDTSQFTPQLRISAEQQQITLQLEVEGDLNPLHPTFFSSVQLPETLL